MSIWRHRAALLVAAAVLGVPVFAGASAQAKQARLFAGTFGGATSTTPNPYPLLRPWSVAVDHSKGASQGDVYVADVGNYRVEKFDSAGHLLLMFGKGVNKTAIEEGKPEVQQNVCLAAEVCQPGLAGPTPGAFQSKTNAIFLAVDSSSGPSAGDVYVADPSDGKGGGVDQVTKFDEAGHIVSSWGTAGQLNGTGLAEGPFWDLAGVAVDSAGNLWVLGRINGSHEPNAFAQAFEFTQDATLITSWNLPSTTPTKQEPSFTHPDGVAVDSIDNLYFAEDKNGGASIAAFGSSGARLGLITNLFFDPESGQTFGRQGGRPGESGVFEPTAFALDPSTNDFYLAETFPAGGIGPTVVRRYSAATCHPTPDPEVNLDSSGCTSTEMLGAGRLGNGNDSGVGHGGSVVGLALDPSSPADALYAVMGEAGELTAFAIRTVPDVATVRATALTGSSARLNGTVNPSGQPLTQCFFEWAEGTEPYAHTAPCEAPDATEVGSGGSPVEVHAQISGLTASKIYHFRLVASNANTDLAEEPSLGQDLTFGPPRIVSASALAVSATSATLQTQLNPNDGETVYHVEYVTQGHFEAVGFSEPARMPDASAGSGDVDITTNTFVQGLLPNTVYHYRLVATNSLGSVEGPDHTFTTQGAPVFLLPDGREWEQVSPPNKHGAPLEPIRNGVIQAAADGSGIAYFANAPFDLEAPGTLSPMESQILSHRGPAGWSSQDVATPHQGSSNYAVGDLSEYKLFSADLSLGAVEPFGATPLSPQTTEKTPYLRQSDGTYAPLVTAANVPEGVKFGGTVDPHESSTGGVLFLTATPDLAHVLLRSGDPLTADFRPGFKPGQESIYEWTAGALQLASWVPSGAAIICGGTGTACVPAGEKKEGSEPGTEDNMHNAISTDGSRVVFKTQRPNAGGILYLRDLARGETLQLDVAQPGAEGESGNGDFVGASADGSHVFFTDGSRLTADSTATAPDLYMCQVGEERDHLSCALKDLTVDHNSGESATVLGFVGASEDGSSVYFVAQGVLATGAVQGTCGQQSLAGDGECNLYRYDTSTESTSLVAVLYGTERSDWSGESVGGEARVSPNGRYVAFMSQRSLTGYDNRDVTSGGPDEEVYLYDSQASPGSQLACVSCNPTGGRPHGVFDKYVFPSLLVDRTNAWRYHTLAASVPDRPSGGGLYYQSRYLSDSGRLFFNSADALAPQDTNGVMDVYQYESPRGSGQPESNNCTSASSSYSPISRGCVSLISSGVSPEESAFLDASEAGNDVFFLTASKLTASDIDAALDVYDAHACSESSPCPPPPPPPPPACTGDSCLNAVEAPNDPTPGSLTFSGPGNPAAVFAAANHTTTRKTVKCKRPKKRNHGKCVSSKRKARKAKRATSKREARR